MSALSARNGGRAGLAVLGIILLLGLVLRVDHAWEGRTPVYDASAYSRIAANLDRGEGFTAGPAATQPSSNYSPGLPLLVASLYKLSGGPDERHARVVLALLGTLSVLFTYLIGRRLSGPGAGLIGAAAVAVYPALLEYQGMLMAEPLATTLLSGAVLAMLWARDSGSPPGAGGSCRGVGDARPRKLRATTPTPRHPPEWRWVIPGLLLGALALTRPEYLGVALLLVLVVLGSGVRREWRVPLANAGILLAGVVLIVAPWTVRNAIALDRFVPISTGGGQVLFAGTYLPSGGDPERVGAEVLERNPGLSRRLPADPRLEQILAALAAQRHPRLETDQALARMGREQLWDDVTDRPLAWLGFEAEKAWNLWGHGPRAVMRKPAWEILHWALVGFGLLGLVLLAHRRRWEALPLAVVIVAITALSAVLVASPRRALVMLPLVAALAGVGLTGCRDSLARRWHR